MQEVRCVDIGRLQRPQHRQVKAARPVAGLGRPAGMQRLVSWVVQRVNAADRLDQR